MKHRLSLWLSTCLALAALPMTACQTTKSNDTAQASNDHAKESDGTAIGAAVGVATGAAIGHGNERGRNAIIGGIVGGIAGNRVGAYMDQQEKELRQNLKGTGVGVQRNGDSIKLVMPSDITFATDRSNIQQKFDPVLDNVASVLQKYPQTRIKVLGHTDATGSAQHNQVLSEQRARSVASYLEHSGINSARIETEGFGESQPIATNKTADGRERNRRVAIELQPVVKPQ